MTEAKKLMEEIKEMQERNAKIRALVKANSEGFPELKKTYTYRKSTIIKPADLNL